MNRIWIKRIICFMLLCGILTTTLLPAAEPVAVQAATAGWEKTSAGYRYKNASGNYLTAQFITLAGKTYYLNKDGYMTTSWKTIKGNRYFFKKDTGIMVRGWLHKNAKWYYFDKTSGIMQREKWIEGKYYVRSDGTMALGWLYNQKKYYYLKSPSGEKATKWLQVGKKWYYFNTKGVRQQSKWISGKYYVKDNGVMATGWLSLGQKTYYFKSDGVRTTGWKKISGTWYYFNAKGVLQEGKKRNSYKVAIDAGHQRTQNKGLEPVGPGASEMKQKVSSGTTGVATGIPEYQLNLTVALKLQKELESRGYDVYMIRTTHDVNISNAERAKMAASSGADILVRIHANGDSDSSVYGALTMGPGTDNPYMTSSVIAKSRVLSQKMIASFCAATGAKNRGVLYYNTMTGINWSTIPVTIIEMGFMSNPSEDRLMSTDAYQNKMTKGIADGIDQYF